MKQRFFMDSLWMFIFTLKVLSNIFVICSKLSPLNINLLSIHPIQFWEHPVLWQIPASFVWILKYRTF